MSKAQFLTLCSGSERHALCYNLHQVLCLETEQLSRRAQLVNLLPREHKDTLLHSKAKQMQENIFSLTASSRVDQSEWNLEQPPFDVSILQVDRSFPLSIQQPTKSSSRQGYNFSFVLRRSPFVHFNPGCFVSFCQV